MSSTALLCNHCGAPLDVPDAARYATCGHCGSRLAIQRNRSAAWTEVAGQIAEDTGQINEGVALLTLQAELERLDREWEMQQAQGHGRRRKRGKDGDTIGAFIGLIIPLFVLYMIFGQGELAPSIVLVVILVIAGIVAVRTGAVARLLGPGMTEEDYQRRRADLVRRIEERGGSL